MSNKLSPVEQLMAIKGEAESIAYDSERDRFNMPHAAETNISNALNANRIVIDGKDFAIATQFPLDQQIEAQLQLLIDNQTPVLVVLASINDIQNNQLIEYFKGSATYGAIQTQSKFLDYVDLDSIIEAKIFNLSVSGYKESLEIQVIHVHNWPDHRTVSTEVTTNLVSLIESKIEQSMTAFKKDQSPTISDLAKALPVMHCKAGVGRTGQTLAAMAMKQFPELSLASIIKDLRRSRNNKTIQTPQQMKTLMELDEMRSKSQAKTQKKQSRSWRSLFGKK
ncbi:protein-tyrosine phosphatase family protein [Leucothrix arctica]|uniref:protein-tyrosine-phosphatase n=1 Tax=Leucothrix arctica TaxID=1481894 RepID=A0A317CC64_9GAMM|nr:protein-tyrosine phosphatase family protein [Leucothrix arctica]PWQ93662.1 tyrosine protein phosphatase [Leucothrix arctica]